MIVEVTELVAEALFASDLQPSQTPTTDQVRAAVTDALRSRGEAGCTACVAAEFGDHPETATRRMAWARQQAARALADAVPSPR